MKKQVFSLRKYKVGLVSIAIGALFVLAPGNTVAADQFSNPTESAASLAEEAPSPALETESASASLLEKREDKQDELAKQAAEQAADTTARETPVSETPSNEPAANSDHAPSPQKSQALAEKNKAAKPLNIDSNAMVSADKVWQEGYKGQGQVIAIIDSGIDPEHDVLRLSDTSTAKYKSKEELEAAKKAAGISYGKWYNDKLIFGYNYMDGDSLLKERDPESHGMHVTGIAAGNPSKEDITGQKILGVAPEAQVMFMRVFSDKNDATDVPLYAKAIEDAVKLGADIINLSLGSANGSMINASEMLLAAVDKAIKAGVSVIIAAGNDNAFGDAYDNPRVENPDFGLVGDPSTVKDAVSVASINNSTYVGDAVTVLSPDGSSQKSTFTYGSKTKFEEKKAYDYVHVGLGYESDYEGLDLTGKAALIQRGDITFQEKVERAIAHGAIAAFIYNNRPEESNLSMGLTEGAHAIPAAFLPQEIGEKLAKGSYQLTFDGSKTTGHNPEGGKMSDFTSWGLAADGAFKPDVTAPGGGIYSSINDGAYASVSGTSMASPHIAGVSALIHQYLKSAYPDLSAKEREDLGRKLLLSSAIPHFNEETGAYTSPRHQGAGVASTHGAIHSDLYLTAADGSSKVQLGNIGDRFNFQVTLHNLSQEERVLSYVTNLTTDLTEEGRFALKPRALEEIPGQEIRIAAGGKKTITISLDASKYRRELEEEMPNGYYLDGFVRFLNPVDGGHIASIPFVGFHGQFQDLAVLEKPVYDAEPGKDELFYHLYDDKGALTSFDNITALITDTSKPNLDTGKHTPQQPKVLGTFENEDGTFTIHKNADGEVSLALSPNLDGNQDSVYFRGVFLRNYENLNVRVYQAEDKDLKNPVWQTTERSSGDKNYYAGVEPMSRLFLHMTWSGQDQTGKDLPDGNYVYVVSYYPVVPGAKKQEIHFPIVLDRQAPVITTAHYDAASRTFNPRPALDKGLSGILRDQVFYLKDVVKKDADGTDVTIQERVYVAKNEQGSFVFDESLDLASLIYEVEDRAGNRDQIKVQELIDLGNDVGRLQVRFLDKQSQRELPISYSFIIKDKDGQTLDLIEKDGDHFNLPFGDYTIEMITYDSDSLRLESPLKRMVHLDADNSYHFLDFVGQRIVKNSLTIHFSQALPAETKVLLIDQDGRQLELPAQTYNPNAYGKQIPVGHYQIQLSLPQGYELMEDELHFDLDNKEPVYLDYTLVNKQALLQAIGADDSLQKEARYYNADPELQEAYQAALTAAKAALEQKLKQEEIDALSQQVQDKKSALKGQETDWHALFDSIQSSLALKQDAKYFNADSSQKLAFDQALTAAQALFGQEAISQKAVDQALAALTEAQEELNGQPSNFSSLDQVISDSQALEKTYLYSRSSREKKEVFDQALLAALELDRKTSSQVEIDQAESQLKTAKESLDGKSPAKRIRFKTETHQVKYNIIEIFNPNLAQGKKRTIQRGVWGLRTDIIEISEAGRRIIWSAITTAPIDKIVEIGTKVMSQPSNRKTSYPAPAISYSLKANLTKAEELTFHRLPKGIRLEGSGSQSLPLLGSSWYRP